MKTKQQETTEKIKKTKEENQKKILEVCGYEVWRDPLNFVTIKGKKNRYFSTFKNALIDIKEEMVRSKLSSVIDLEHAIKRIESSDEAFLKALSTCLDMLGDEYKL